MPQLEQIYTYTSQIFWILVSFGVIYLFLSRFVVPRLGGVIELRENTISSNVDKARNLKDEAVATENEFELRSATSRSNGFNIISKGSTHANALYDKGISDTDAELKKFIETSEREINSYKEVAARELEKNVPDLVQEIVSRIAGISPAKK
jgi:F-type H+-transporting ATPase subunit b